MIRLIPFLLYFWLIAMHQVFLKDITSIYHITIKLPVLLVLLVALYKSELVCTWFGFITGIVVNIGSSSTIGWHALILVGFSLLAFHLREKLNLDSIYARLLFVFVGVLSHNVISLILLYKGDSFFFMLWSVALTSTIYTTFIAWVFFLVKDETITLEKFKSIF